MCFERLNCSRCVNGIQTETPPVESDCTNDLSCWQHCSDKRWLVDPLLKQAWPAGLSFVFYQHSHKQTKPQVSSSTFNLFLLYNSCYTVLINQLYIIMLNKWMVSWPIIYIKGSFWFPWIPLINQVLCKCWKYLLNKFKLRHQANTLVSLKKKYCLFSF
jgi:hypothetical protein